ncbi:MAG: hypothetical protein WD072_04510, partial [Pirellulales bacterium]
MALIASLAIGISASRSISSNSTRAASTSESISVASWVVGGGSFVISASVAANSRSSSEYRFSKALMSDGFSTSMMFRAAWSSFSRRSAAFCLESGAGELVGIHRLLGLAACQLLDPLPHGLAAADLVHLLPQGWQRESGELLTVHAVASAALIFNFNRRFLPPPLTLRSPAFNCRGPLWLARRSLPSDRRPYTCLPAIRGLSSMFFTVFTCHWPDQGYRILIALFSSENSFEDVVAPSGLEP